ncbi:hypothetical protein M2321_000001, partial [Rhodoblastus acidophilus]|nr:hypothetical protein [Rhodoblastus acidophilus]
MKNGAGGGGGGGGGPPHPPQDCGFCDFMGLTPRKTETQTNAARGGWW